MTPLAVLPYFKVIDEMKQVSIHKICRMFALPLLLALWACQDELDNGQTLSGNYLTLTLQTSAASTRAPIVGEDRFNENEVKSVDVYFFADGQENTAEYLYAKEGLVPEGSLLQVELDKTIIQDNNNYYIYVVVNRTGSSNTTFTEANGRTLAALQERTITTNWKEGYEDESVTEECLVMDGSTTVTVNPEGTQGHVKLTRAMAKVMLYAAAEESIEMDNVTYTPVLNQMNVTMVYGVKRTNLEGTYTVTAADDAENSDYITRMRRDYTSNTITETITEGEGEDAKEIQIQYYEQEVPFYSYPNSKTTADRQDAYLILCVPWEERYQGGSYRSHNYYYRIPITGSTAPATLERNHYYRIKVNIGVLGSLNPNEAVEITDADFEILDWFDMEVVADMQKYEYLVLDEYNSVMNNVNSIENAYTSSSNIDWDKTKIISVSYWDYHSATSYQVNLTEDNTFDEDNTDSHVRFDDFKIGSGVDETIRVSHTLDEENDFVKYTITVKVYNTDGVEADLWTIEQYPARYIEGYFNTGGANNRFINGYSGTNGTAYDNGGRGGSNGLGSISDWTGNNANRNLYTIYISSFSDDTYAIGDPRSESFSDFDNDLDATEYRATRQDAEIIVAPAYKIASSWGKTTVIDYNTALRRCASYQEAGYPAGRWRIPTKAEVEYMIQLTERRKIPRLFNAYGDYWTSSGIYTADANPESNFSPGTGGNAYVRCVYDVWYWGEQTIEEDENNPTGNGHLTNTDFVWGDNIDGTLERGYEH